MGAGTRHRHGCGLRDGRVAWHKAWSVLLSLKPLIPQPLTCQATGMGSNRPHGSPIYTLWTKGIVTGSNIDFLRSHNFLRNGQRRAGAAQGHRPSDHARNGQRRAGKPSQHAMPRHLGCWPPSTLFGQTNQGQGNVVRANQANMSRKWTNQGNVIGNPSRARNPCPLC